MADENQRDITTLTVQLLSAFVSKNEVSSEGLADLIKTTRAALTEDLNAPVTNTTADHVPAVSVRKSLSSPDHIISLIDGKPYKTLKRHLAVHDLTAEQYRERYKLPKSYPMVAPSYSDARRAVAERLGLGKKPAQGASTGTTPAPTKGTHKAQKSSASTKARSDKAAKKPPLAATVETMPATANAKPKDVKAPASTKTTPRKRLSISVPKSQGSAASASDQADPASTSTPPKAATAKGSPSKPANAKPTSKVKKSAKTKAGSEPITSSENNSANSDKNVLTAAAD